ncbi:hypothetical protein [Ancylomarina sp. 16SWW S1-10-2]|uniref:hypothetical protein n=1 Tax=Ancylomarina sp. 16SWW S1-10-2 TaxID=2499681 RepID=UPI0012ADE000|nr:hypothetical protein [Ancylomarina sp. 16SWW S1-10-2]MRT92396.1 hypothetical protein [Ancylomarina sp. 16SWW S1-10-2]
MPNVTTAEQSFHSKFSKNVSQLESARRLVNSQINNALRKNDDHAVKLYTNIYLMVYSSWSEAYLVKLIHTPSGFTEIEKKAILRDRDVLNKWKKCVSTAFSKFRDNGSEIPNKKQRINSLLDEYLKIQANIRNKIAHGQWVYPLYSKNLKHDPDALLYMSMIDVIQIDTWFEILKEIVEIVRGLIDSKPGNNHKAHYNEYFTRLSNIQEIIESRKSWTLDDKRSRLLLKPIKR